MGGLPSRIGHCKALDASISYLLSVHASMQAFGTVDSRPYQYKQYGQALQYLKQDLEAPGNENAEALVAATIVLGDAEVFLKPFFSQRSYCVWLKKTDRLLSSSITTRKASLHIREDRRRY